MLPNRENLHASGRGFCLRLKVDRGGTSKVFPQQLPLTRNKIISYFLIHMRCEISYPHARIVGVCHVSTVGSVCQVVVVLRADKEQATRLFAQAFLVFFLILANMTVHYNGARYSLELYFILLLDGSSSNLTYMSKDHESGSHMEHIGV
jgi:hypothetical protein